MKPAYYLLTAVLILVIGLAGILLLGTRTAPPSVEAPKPRDVYVDLAVLLREYPPYRALGSLSIGAAPVPPAGQPAPCLTFPPINPLPTDGMLDCKARQQLEADTARDAVMALSRLEVVRNDALDAKMRLLRAELVRQSAEQIGAEILAIEKDRTRALTEALCCLAIERINALLRISALRAQLEVPILDQGVVKANLACEKDQLGILEDRRSTERGRIEREFQGKIDELARRAAAEISEQLAAAERAGRQEIADDVRQARAALLRDLSERNGSAAYAAAKRAVPSRIRVTICPGLRAFEEPAQGSDRRGAVAAVRARLQATVERAVVLAAEQAGMRVSFIPRVGIPDETAAMLRLLRQRAWGTGGAS